jgi:5-methylcytosine-specific restriction endonuclease McrA
MDNEYVSKLEKEIKRLTRRERYLRKTLDLLIEMVEGLLEDPTCAECPSFMEILNDMKNKEQNHARLQKNRGNNTD